MTIEEEAAEEIATLFEESMENGLEDLSDDVVMQVVMEASRLCDMWDIDREERPRVISEGLRKYLNMQIDDTVHEFKYNLDVWYSL